MTGGNQDKSEDILQEIFIKVYRNLNGFKPKLIFSSWVYRIAHNEIINQYSKNNKHSDTVSLNDSDELHLTAALIYDEDIHNMVVYGGTAEAAKTAFKEFLIFKIIQI